MNMTGGGGLMTSAPGTTYRQPMYVGSS